METTAHPPSVEDYSEGSPPPSPPPSPPESSQPSPPTSVVVNVAPQAAVAASPRRSSGSERRGRASDGSAPSAGATASGQRRSRRSSAYSGSGTGSFVAAAPPAPASDGSTPVTPLAGSSPESHEPWERDDYDPETAYPGAAQPQPDTAQDPSDAYGLGGTGYDDEYGEEYDGYGGEYGEGFAGEHGFDPHGEWKAEYDDDPLSPSGVSLPGAVESPEEKPSRMERKRSSQEDVAGTGLEALTSQLINEDILPEGVKKHKRKHKKYVDQDGNPLTKHEVKLLREKQKLEEAAQKRLAKGVLARSAFAFSAWLDPKTDQQEQVLHAERERKRMARIKRTPSEEQRLQTLGRWGYCMARFKKNHFVMVKLFGYLMIALWRITYVLDIATDLIAMMTVNKFDKGYGFFLIVLSIAPYIVSAIGVFNVVVREIPRLLKRHRIELADTNTVIWSYIIFAPLWVVLVDVAINVRFAFVPTQGHYPIAFERMKRVALLIIDVTITTVIQFQIITVDIEGVETGLLGNAIAVSFLNLAINGRWLYVQIKNQHRPWYLYIVDSFRAGLSHIPHLDSVRDGVEILEYFGGLSHPSEMNTIGDAIVDSGDKCKVKTLVIQRCFVNDEGCNALTHMLLKNTTIASLNLDHNEVKDVGIKHLARALQQNTALKTLSVAHNQVDDDGIKFFTATLRQAIVGIGLPANLTTLDLRWNYFGPAAVQSVSLALKHNRCALTSLDLSANRIGIPGAQFLRNALLDNSRLKTLHINQGLIVEEGAAAIAQGLTSYNSKTSTTGISTLSFAGNKCGDIGVSAFWQVLVENTSLTKLDLSGNNFTDFGGKELAENLIHAKNLRHLDVMFNRMSPETIEEFAEAQLELPDLDLLLIGANSLTRDGFRSRVKRNKPMVALTLGLNPRLRFKPFPK